MELEEQVDNRKSKVLVVEGKRVFPEKIGNEEEPLWGYFDNNGNKIFESSYGPTILKKMISRGYNPERNSTNYK